MEDVKEFVGAINRSSITVILNVLTSTVQKLVHFTKQHNVYILSSNISGRQSKEDSL